MPSAATRSVTLEFGDGEIVAPVLTRVVSAAAAQADLPVDRLIDTLTAVDALSTGMRLAARDGRICNVVVQMEPSEVRVAVDCKDEEHGADVLRLSALPDYGNVIERFANTVSVQQQESGSARVAVSFR